MPSVNYLWDPIEDNVIAEFDDAGNLIVDYTTEPDLYGNVISQHRDGETNVFYSDTLGSTVAVTNQAGGVVATRAYSGFGEATESTGTLCFRFSISDRRAITAIRKLEIHMCVRDHIGQ